MATALAAVPVDGQVAPIEGLHEVVAVEEVRRQLDSMGRRLIYRQHFRDPGCGRRAHRLLIKGISTCDVQLAHIELFVERIDGVALVDLAIDLNTLAAVRCLDSHFYTRLLRPLLRLPLRHLGALRACLHFGSSRVPNDADFFADFVGPRVLGS